MRKKRFWYWLLSLIICLGVMIFTFIFPSDKDILLYFLVGLILVPNFTMRSNEKNILIAIMGNYAINCNAEIYLKNMKKYYSECYFSKKGKRFNNIVLSMIYMDLGDFDKGKELLMGLVNYVDKFPFFQKYTYYRAWTMYYYEKGELNHMKVLLEEMKKIIEVAKGTLKLQLLTNYSIVEAKYFIAEGIYMDKARSLFNDMLTVNNVAPVMRLSAHFYLGVIHFKTGNYEKAIEEFKYVSCSEKKLYLVEKSQKYLDVIDEHLQKQQ